MNEEKAGKQTPGILWVHYISLDPGKGKGY